MTSLSSAPPFTPTRFVACDISSQSIVVAAVDADQQIVLQPKKIAVARFVQWASQNLHKTDAVVYEAACDAWHWYDVLLPMVGKLVVAHPQKVALIAKTRVKTDARDALALARLLVAGLIPEVWIPPRDVRDLRELVAHRARLIRQRTQARNHLHSLLLAYHHVPPAGDPFAHKHLAWWQDVPLPPTAKLRLDHELVCLNSLSPLIAAVEKELIERSTTERWRTASGLLIQLPGIGVLNAMVLLSAIGDITRFPSAKHLVGYSGLGAGVYASGKVFRTGGITKQGRRELRTVLVEAAWTAVDHSPYWKEQFGRIRLRLGDKKAIVAIARRLLVTIWHVLTKGEADKHADIPLVERKILTWSNKLRAAGRQGVGRPEFIAGELARLGFPTSATVDGEKRHKTEQPLAPPA